MGLVGDAKRRLASLVRHLEQDRSILGDSEFFDARGLRLKVEEVVKH